MNKTDNKNNDIWALNTLESATEEFALGGGTYPKQKVEFLAKTLLQGQSSGLQAFLAHSYVVLGTPIYVAIAD